MYIILFMFIALANGQADMDGPSLLVLKLTTEEIGIGIVSGIGLIVLAIVMLRTYNRYDWMTEDWRQLPVVAPAIVCFTTAQVAGGSGFIAAFTGGLLYGRVKKQQKRTLLLSAESVGDTLSLLTWVIFGAGVIGQVTGAFRWQDLLYAALSLTVIRMVPVFFVLAGTDLRTDEKMFMGWFGPRGLASIVFAVIVLNEHLPGGKTITMSVICTVILSVIAYGISVNPLVAGLAARSKRDRA